LAIRGTDYRNKDWRDYYADFQIALGRVPYQIKAAETALTQEEGGKDSEYSILLTGHSLGGALASLLATKQANKPRLSPLTHPV
jgi:alpha-beta hydrolase superfamily lysophospholipase